VAYAGQHGKIARELAGNQSSNQVDVIVQFTQTPTARHHQKVMDLGGRINRNLGHFKGGAYRLPASMVERLAKDPEVTYISPDRPLKGASTSTTSVPLDYHTDTVNAAAAAALGLDGTGVGLAVIDSGIASVADLSSANIVYSQDFTGSGSAVDQYGHGTHVAGIIAGNGASSSAANDFYTFKGIAPGVSLVNLRALDANGTGTDSTAIAAIDAAIQLQSTYNIRVISLSVGRPVYESYTQDPLCQAVEQAWQAGIVVVVAAGNYGRDNLAGTNGYGTITAPGNDPYVITVGATNTEGSATQTGDVPASYSSKGPTLFDTVVKPDLVAPGNGIISLYFPGSTLDQASPANEVPLATYQTNGSNASSGSYFSLSGTSMATPMVSAAAALLLQQTPTLTPDQVKARLMKSAFKNMTQFSTAVDATTGITYNEQTDIFTVGAGELDINAALANTDLAPANAGSALSPSVGLDSNGNVVLLTGASVLGGSDIIVWGTSAVWGDEIIVWGTGGTNSDIIVWGTSAPGSDIIVWGTSGPASDIIVWGTSGPANDIIVWGTGGPGNDIIVWGTGTPGSDIIVWGTANPASIRDK
jgi:serine protease AprX